MNNHCQKCAEFEKPSYNNKTEFYDGQWEDCSNCGEPAWRWFELTFHNNVKCPHCNYGYSTITGGGILGTFTFDARDKSDTIIANQEKIILMLERLDNKSVNFEFGTTTISHKTGLTYCDCLDCNGG